MSAGRFAARSARRSGSSVEADLISRLRTLPGPVPDAQFRSDLRSQLVAITARVVAESGEPAAASPSGVVAGAAARRSGAFGGGALRALRRPALALAGASTVLVMLLGMAVWMAGGALPGQSLYGVKRASENVQLSMAGNDTAKGWAYLRLAGNRAREAADLLGKPAAMVATGGVTAGGARISPHTASLVTDTLASADADSRSGMQLLGRAAVAQLSKDPLTRVSDWFAGQRALLTGVRDRIPTGALHNRAQASLTLLQRIATRTAQLNSKMGCPCLAQALSDELGPLPCSPCGTVRNQKPGAGASLPVPVPGLGSTTPLPSLSLPALGGATGGSSSGHAAPGGPSLPALGTPVSSPAGGLPSAGGTSAVPAGPISVGPGGVSVTLPGGTVVTLTNPVPVPSITTP